MKNDVSTASCRPYVGELEGCREGERPRHVFWSSVLLRKWPALGGQPVTSGILKDSKDIPVTGREGPYGCETSRLPHFL
jgi:hypothetical protein